MLIVSNCLTENADEGGLKLATSLVKRIVKAKEDTFVVTYERESALSSVSLPINKLMLSPRLISLIRSRRESVLYIPFPAPSLSAALRIWVLSLFAKWGLKVVMLRQYPMEKAARTLLRRSKAELIVFSEQARAFYEAIADNKVTCLKAGVDTARFVPVSSEEKTALRIKHGFDPRRPMILHVGHMKEGRNIRQLTKLDPRYQVVLVISTLSKNRQDPALREALERCGNIRIIDEYVPNIEAFYQMSDVYFFPVEQPGHCIDVPLSCMEAAACGKPVVTTDFGEMEQLVGTPGFFPIDDFGAENLNRLIESALAASGYDTRSAVLAYDWDHAVKALTGAAPRPADD